MGENPEIDTTTTETERATFDQMLRKQVASRGLQWEEAINGQLQSLVTQASNIRRQIDNAKTGTKKRYFQKKFTKVSGEVRQMIVALQRIQANNTNTAPPTNADDSTSTI